MCCAADNREDDAGEDAEDGREFFPAVQFVEEIQSAGKGHERAGAAQAHDDGDEGIGIPQRPEVGVVGHEQRERDERHAPTPAEFIARPQPQLPAQGERREERNQIDGKPALDRRYGKMQRVQEVAVVERADRAENISHDQGPEPFITHEMNTLFLAGKRESDKGGKGGEDAEGFQPVWAFAQEYDRATEGEQGTGGADGRSERERQMFQRVVGADPRGGHDGGFQQQLQMLFERERIGDERGRQESRMHRLHGQQDTPDQGAGQGAEKEDGRDGITAHRVLGTQVVKSEKKCGQQCGQDPIHVKSKTGEPVWLARRLTASNFAEDTGWQGACQQSHFWDQQTAKNVCHRFK